MSGVWKCAYGGGRLLGTLLVPVALSYLLDHALLWRLDGSGGAGGAGEQQLRRWAAGSAGPGGVRGATMRGRVAVVLDGYKGLGYQVAR